MGKTCDKIALMLSSFVKKILGILVISLFFSSLVSAQTANQQTATSTLTPEQIRQQILDSLSQTPDIKDALKDYTPPEPIDINDLPAEYRKISLVVTSTPEIPGPNEQVHVNLESYSTDLNRAQITWSVNGKVIKRGIGEKDLDYKVGKIGAVTTLSITVESADGNSTNHIVRIAPAEVDLLWEATTYVPPFYKGRALPSYQSPIKVTAVPNMIQNGKNIPPQNMIFKWFRNGDIVNKDSGFGKSTFYVSDNIPIEPLEISVEASSLDGLVQAKKTILIQQVAPKVLIYEKNPLQGIEYQKALFDFSLSTQEISFAAVPYFFSTKDKQINLKYTWSLNGSAVPEQNSAIATFGNKSGAVGNASARVDVAHTQNIFQLDSTQTEISLLGQEEDSSF